jgi:hypothetical protein
MTAHEDRIRLYEAELARLDDLHAHLEQLWTQVPRYGYLALLAPVTWWFFGFGWALTHVLVTGALVGTQAYLIGVRKNENRWTRASVAQDLERLRSEPHAP